MNEQELAEWLASAAICAGLVEGERFKWFAQEDGTVWITANGWARPVGKGPQELGGLDGDENGVITDLTVSEAKWVETLKPDLSAAEVLKLG